MGETFDILAPLSILTLCLLNRVDQATLPIPFHTACVFVVCTTILSAMLTFCI